MAKKRKNKETDDDLNNAAVNGDNHPSKRVKQPNDSYHDNDLNTIYNNKLQFQGIMRKYWAQRKNLFSEYDNGVLLTKELWFSVTPEKISVFITNFIAKKFVKNINILDSFSGGGGNIVQFLLNAKFKNVVAVDINKIHLNCTRVNSLVYNNDVDDVENRLKLLPIDWMYLKDGYQGSDLDIDGDTYATQQDSLTNLEILSKMKFDCVFGSPPWGGPTYLKDEVFDLNNILPFGLEELLTYMLHYSENLCLFLPRNSDLKQIVDITQRVYAKRRIKSPVTVKVVHLESGGYQKGILCCWGVFSLP